MEAESNLTEHGTHGMGKLAVIGPGLLGGSVALAAKNLREIGCVALWARREDALAELRDCDAADVISNDISEIASEADLVVLATPVGALGELTKSILPHLKSGAIITDLCSVKVSAVEFVENAISDSGREDVDFVGAHPMAGSENVGFAHARADLFKGSVCAVTSGNKSNSASEEFVTKFWESIGCSCVSLDSSYHDELVARVSHLPHLIASAIVETAVGGKGKAETLAGPGLRDMTRIAVGAPEMWAEILCQNQAAVANVLDEHIDRLRTLLTMIRDVDNENLLHFLSDARDKRLQLYQCPDDKG